MSRTRPGCEMRTHTKKSVKKKANIHFLWYSNGIFTIRFSVFDLLLDSLRIVWNWNGIVQLSLPPPPHLKIRALYVLLLSSPVFASQLLFHHHLWVAECGGEVLAKCVRAPAAHGRHLISPQVFPFAENCQHSRKEDDIFVTRWRAVV